MRWIVGLFIALGLWQLGQDWPRLTGKHSTHTGWAEPAYATTHTNTLNSVVITEVHPNPLTGPEWVELYNPTSSPISLTGWTLEDQLASPSIIVTFTTQVLLPQTYQHFELTTQKLNNTSDGVTLKNAQGTIVDSMNYTSSSQGESWSRLSLSHPTWTLTLLTPSLTNPQPATTPTPTPTSSPIPSPSPTQSPSPSTSPIPATTPTPSPPASYPLTLQPSEIMACPATGENEWLEIFNPSQTEVQLDNWRVKDETSNYRTVSAVAPAQGYAVLSWSSSFLNNAGDSITLLTPTDQSVFTIDLGACQKGQSFIFSHDEWQVTTQPTKGRLNTLTQTSMQDNHLTPVTEAITTHASQATVSAKTQLRPTTHFQTPHKPSDVRLTVPVALPFTQTQPDLMFGPALDHTRLKWPIVSVIMGGTVMLAINTFGWYYVRNSHNASFPNFTADLTFITKRQSQQFP